MNPRATPPLPGAMDVAIMPLRDFAKNSIRLLNRCTKPARNEYYKIVVRTGVGFIVMGFIGFFVKLIFIPINQIIVGGSLA